MKISVEELFPDSYRAVLQHRKEVVGDGRGKTQKAAMKSLDADVRRSLWIVRQDIRDTVRKMKELEKDREFLQKALDYLAQEGQQ